MLGHLLGAGALLGRQELAGELGLALLARDHPVRLVVLQLVVLPLLHVCRKDGVVAVAGYVRPQLCKARWREVRAGERGVCVRGQWEFCVGVWSFRTVRAVVRTFLLEL